MTSDDEPQPPAPQPLTPTAFNPGPRSDEKVKDQGDLWADDAEPAAGAEAPQAFDDQPDAGLSGPAGPAPAVEGDYRDLEPEPATDGPTEPAPPIEVLPLPARPDFLQNRYADYDYDYADIPTYGDRVAGEAEEPRTSPLRNPYVLAGLAVGGAVLLAALVVAVFGRGGESGGNTPTPTPPPTQRPALGILAQTTAATRVRDGPGLEYADLGLLQSGATVDVVGRNSASSWFQIVYPPESQSRGWVPASSLSLPDGAASRLEVVNVAPIDRATVPPPTPTPAPPTPTPPPPTPTPTEIPPIALFYDMALAPASGCSAGENFVVTLQNIGSLALQNQPVRVTVQTPSATLANQVENITLAPGQSATINTNRPVLPPRTTVTVAFADGSQENNTNNNAVTCVVTGQPSITPTPQ